LIEDRPATVSITLLDKPEESERFHAGTFMSVSGSASRPAIAATPCRNGLQGFFAVDERR